MTEWIEHHGKGYPDLPMYTLVQVRFADGVETDQLDALDVAFWSINWVHDDPVYDCDIVAYRVVTK